jgi:trk system potassium uptake protein TrkA
MRVTVTERWVGRKVAELESATGARVTWMVRFGEAQLATPGTVLQDGDQLVMAVIDDIVQRVHDVIEGAAEGVER